VSRIEKITLFIGEEFGLTLTHNQKKAQNRKKTGFQEHEKKRGKIDWYS